MSHRADVPDPFPWLRVVVSDLLPAGMIAMTDATGRTFFYRPATGRGFVLEPVRYRMEPQFSWVRE